MVRILDSHAAVLGSLSGFSDEALSKFPKILFLIEEQLSMLKFIMKFKCHILTVPQIQVYPKKNAPGVSKPPRVVKSDFLLILKIFSNLDDIQPSN